MTLYADRLCAATVLAVLRRPRGAGRVRTLLTLDALPAAWRLVLYRVALRARGVTVERLPFFLGDLRTADGESLYRHLRRQASAAAMEEAGRIVARVPFLRALEARYRPGTVTLHIAKRLHAEIEPRLRHVAIARAVAGARARLLLARPERFDGAVLAGASDGLDLEWYRDWRGTVLLPLLRVRARLYGSALALRRLAAWPLPPRDAGARPGLLIPQQDELGLDRSVRQQPHWLFPDSRPTFSTYVWMNAAAPPPRDLAGLTAAGIVPVPAAVAERIAAAQAGTALSRRLLADRRHAVREAGSTPDCPAAYALLTVAQLLRRAYVGAGLCTYFGIKAFLTGENYFVESDAMPLIGDAAGVRTASYQYSNISHRSVPMLTTADVLMTFSPMYEAMWRAGEIGPRKAVSTGYPYRAAFPLLRERAGARRARLEGAGARFVIAYFDESVQSDAYGQVHLDHHRGELLRLFQFVADHSDVGLIVKTQFERNSPSRLCAGTPELAAVVATGRYDEVLSGTHRNVYLPAEAAMASDIAVGSAIGATAALEAALAGTRTVLLNPFGWRGAWDHLYAKAAIVQRDLDTALDAIQRFRAGDQAQAALGDWSPILRHFDPYPEANNRRALDLLEELVAGGARVDSESVMAAAR